MFRCYTFKRIILIVILFRLIGVISYDFEQAQTCFVGLVASFPIITSPLIIRLFLDFNASLMTNSSSNKSVMS